MRAAAALFLEKGYASTTLEEVGNAVDLLPPSLYRYFKSKEDILGSIVMPSAEVGTRMMEEVAGSAKPPSQKLREAFHVHIGLFDDHYPDMFVVTAVDLNALNEEISIHLQTLKERYTQAWMSIVEAYIKDNPALSDLDPQIVTFAALGMCNWMYTWYGKNGRVSPSEIANQYYRIFAQSIADKSDLQDS